MIIPDDPHKGLLDDESASKIASEQLKPWTNLLRDLANYGSTVRLTATIAIDVFMKILQEYREGERARFWQKYVEKWRQAFMNIPELKIEERNLASPED